MIHTDTEIQRQTDRYINRHREKERERERVKV